LVTLENFFSSAELDDVKNSSEIC